MIPWRSVCILGCLSVISLTGHQANPICSPLSTYFPAFCSEIVSVVFTSFDLTYIVGTTLAMNLGCWTSMIFVFQSWGPIFKKQWCCQGKKKDGEALGAIFFMQPGLTLTGLYSQSHGFSSSHVWMWELNHKEGWVPKNWCLQTVVLEKTLGNPLDSQEIKPVNPKGNKPWIFLGRTDTKAEAPILWSSNAKSWLTGKASDARKDWRQKEKRVAVNEMVR